MFNPENFECVCRKCQYSWRARTEQAPKKCPSCTSLTWNETGTRKFTNIIARVGKWSEDKEKLELCFLDYVDRPQVVTDDVFYLKKEYADKYLFNCRYPEGSALVLIGSFSIGEDLMLDIQEMKLIYGHAVGFNQYLSSANCLFNIKSFYQRQAAQKRRDEEEARKTAAEEEHNKEIIEQARLQLQLQEERKEALEAAKLKLVDENATTEEKMQAIADIQRR